MRRFSCPRILVYLGVDRRSGKSHARCLVGDRYSFVGTASFDYRSRLFTTAALAHDIGHEHEHVEGGWNARGGFVSDTDITAKLWSPRGKSQQEIDQRAGFVERSFDGARTPEERAADAEIRGLLGRVNNKEVPVAPPGNLLRRFRRDSVGPG